MDGPREAYQAWYMLSAAKLITTNIATIPDSEWQTNFHPVVGINIPDSQLNPPTGLGKPGYLMVGAGSALGADGAGVGPMLSPWDDGSTNAIFLASINPLRDMGLGALTIQETFNIDQKIDDGSFDSNGNAIGASSGIFRPVQGTFLYIEPCTTNNDNLHYNLSFTYSPWFTSSVCAAGMALN